MALTREFRETVYNRAQKDGAFRKALLTEAVKAYLGGDEGRYNRAGLVSTMPPPGAGGYPLIWRWVNGQAAAASINRHWAREG